MWQSAMMRPSTSATHHGVVSTPGNRIVAPPKLLSVHQIPELREQFFRDWDVFHGHPSYQDHRPLRESCSIDDFNMPLRQDVSFMV
jgi:hypothetical protein